jgi:hypothetical protein
VDPNWNKLLAEMLEETFDYLLAKFVPGENKIKMLVMGMAELL